MWYLASCTPLASYVTVSKLCGSWQTVVVGKLCGRRRAVWLLASYIPLASFVPVGELCAGWASCMPLASCVPVGELYTFTELCGRWRAVWPLASCVAGGRLCGGLTWARRREHQQGPGELDFPKENSTLDMDLAFLFFLTLTRFP